MKKIDLTHKVYGKLTVLKENRRCGTRGYWLCQCECGNTIEVEGGKLRNGLVQNCGCVSSTYIPASQRIGEQIGKLTAAAVSSDKDNTGNTILEWRCSCGNKVFKSYHDIITTHTKSCGCSKYKKIPFQKDLRFGKLVTVAEMPSQNNNTMWLCKCDCGNEKIIKASSLINNKVKSCGCLKSKGELEIKTLLQANNIAFETEKYFSDLPKINNKQILRYDFYVDNSYLIEFDGEQHYESRARVGF